MCSSKDQYALFEHVTFVACSVLDNIFYPAVSEKSIPKFHFIAVSVLTMMLAKMTIFQVCLLISFINLLFFKENRSLL